jgi:hypothetical protein
MQKKQKRPRSSKRPRLIPIKREIGAVPAFSPFESWKAVTSNPITIESEIAVLIFWPRVHAELEVPSESGPPAACRVLVITLLPR